VTHDPADHPTVTRIPYRLEPFGERGWTVFEATDPYEAAAFVARHPDAAMPCWRRYKTIHDGARGYLVMTP
jgi:hypothetical protein